MNLGGNVKKLAMILVLGLMLTATASFAESKYTYYAKKDAAIGAAAVGVFALPFFIGKDAVDDITSLDKSAINAFDRSLMFSFNKDVDTLSQIGAYGLLVLPALSLTGNISDFNAIATYGVMYAETFLLTYGTKDILKQAINRPRPYRYFGDAPEGKEDDYDDSFPSGHTSLAFMSAGFLTATFLTEYPASRWKFAVVGGAYTLAVVVAASRVFSGSHYLTDVIAGAAIGSLYGYLIPSLHLRNSADRYIVFVPVCKGFVFSIKF
jgi:membrane-associated phospholipid phosphatase